MAAITDFLFEGKPPKSVTTYGQTIKDVPKWLSDYTQGLIARANAAAAEPYIPYGGPRIAPFTPAQQGAFELTEQNIGAYQPYLEGAAGATQAGLGALERVSGADPAGAAAGDLAAASEAFPDAVGRYMDPYVGHVLDRQEDLASRTLEEKFLPALQRTFAGAGQYGSRGGFGSMEDIGVRGVRDIQEGLERQRLATLSGAYGQAGELFGADAARRAEVGRLRGALEEAGGRLGLAGAEAGFAGARQLGALGEAAQQFGMRDAAALEAIGRQQQELGQRGLDLAYEDFREQRDLPFERLGFMSEIVRGLPTSERARTTERAPASAYQPSPLSQLIGAYGTYRGLTGSARGGRVRRAHGGLARATIDLAPEDYEVLEMGKP